MPRRSDEDWKRTTERIARRKKKKPAAKPSPQKPQAAEVVPATRKRPYGQLKQKPQLPLYRPPESLLPTVPVKELQQGEALAENIQNMTTAFMGRWNTRPTALQASSMLQVAGDRVLSLMEWGRIVDVGLEADPIASMVTRNILEYYGTTGKLPDATKAANLIQEDMRAEHPLPKPGRLIAPLKVGEKEIDIYDVVSNHANERQEPITSGKKKRWTHKDLSRMPEFAPENLSPEEKADWLRQLANRPMFTLKKRWNSVDEGEMKDAPLMTQEDMDKINAAREWYGMTPLYKQIHEPHVTVASNLFNPDGTTNEDAVRLLADITGQQHGDITGPHTFTGLRKRTAGKEWSQLDKDERADLRTLDEKFASIYPEYKRPKDGRPVWDAAFDRWASLYLFEANIGPAVAYNPYDKVENKAKWLAAERAIKAAKANLSIATYGRIRPEDDIRQFMQDSGFLGKKDKTTTWAEQFTEYLFQCYLRSVAPAGESIEQSMMTFAAQQNPSNPRAALPSSLRKTYDLMMKDFEFTVLAQQENPLNPFAAMFSEELRTLKFLTENELARKAMLGFEPEVPEKKGGRKTPRPIGPIPPYELTETGDIVLGERIRYIGKAAAGKEQITIDVDDDFAMFMHFVLIPFAYSKTIGIYLDEIPKAKNRFYTFLALLGDYESGLHTKGTYLSPLAPFQAIADKLGPNWMKANMASAAQGYTVPLDPRQWKHTWEAWSEAGVRSENYNASPFMRHEFESMGIDPEENQFMLFWADLMWQIQTDLAIDAGIAAVARSGVKSTAAIMRKINSERMNAAIDLAKSRLMNKFTRVPTISAKTGRIGTKWEPTGELNITIDDILAPDGHILTTDEIVAKFDDLAKQADQTYVDLFQKQADVAAHKAKVKKMKESGVWGPRGPVVARPPKQKGLTIGDYYRKKARAIIEDPDYIEYHNATRPAWYDLMGTSLAKLNISGVKVAAILNLKKAHVGRKNEALFMDVLERIGRSNDEEEIVKLMNFLRVNFLLDVDPGRTWFGKMHHFNRITSGELFAKYSYVIPNTERITGGARNIEEHVYNLGVLTRMGLPLGKTNVAHARVWQYMDRLWALDHSLPEDELNRQRLRIWKEFTDEIVDNLKNNKSVSTRLNHIIMSMARRHKMNLPDKLTIDNQWEAFYVSRRIKNSKLLGRTIEPGAVKRGAWYDVFEPDKPFLIAGEKGTGQQAYDLITPFNMHDLVSFQNGKMWNEMLATAPGTGIPPLYLLGIHAGPSWTGVANIGRTFATGSVSFVLSTLMIDEVYRFLVEALRGQISTIGGRQAKRLVPHHYREVGADAVQSWLEHSPDIVKIEPDDPLFATFAQVWFQKMADTPFWDDFYQWVQTPEVQALIELDKTAPGIFEAAIKARLYEVMQDSRNSGVRLSMNSLGRGFIDYSPPDDLLLKQNEWDEAAEFLDWKVNEARMEVDNINKRLRDILSQRATVTRQRDLIEELPLQPRQMRHAEKLIEEFRAKAGENINLKAALDEWDARPNSASWKKLVREIKKDYDDRLAVLRRELRDARSRERVVAKEAEKQYKETAEGRAKARKGRKSGSPYKWILLEKDGKFVWTDDVRFTHKKPPESGWAVVDQTTGKSRRVTTKTRKWEEYTDEVVEEPVAVPAGEMPERGWVAGKKVDDPVYSYEMDNGKIINIDKSVDGTYYEVSMLDFNPNVDNLARYTINRKFDDSYGSIKFKSPEEAIGRLADDFDEIPRVSQKQIDDARAARISRPTGELDEMDFDVPAQKKFADKFVDEQEGGPSGVRELARDDEVTVAEKREELRDLYHDEILDAWNDEHRVITTGAAETTGAGKTRRLEQKDGSLWLHIESETTDDYWDFHILQYPDGKWYIKEGKPSEEGFAARGFRTYNNRQDAENALNRAIQEERAVDNAPPMDPSDPNYIPPRNVVDVERDIVNEENARTAWLRKKGPKFEKVTVPEEFVKRVAKIEEILNAGPPTSKAWIANWLVEKGLMTRDRVGPALFPKTWKRGKVLPQEKFKSGENVHQFFKNNGLSDEDYYRMRDDWEAERLAELDMTSEREGLLDNVYTSDKSVKQIVDEIRARRVVVRTQRNMWRELRRAHAKSGRPVNNRITRRGERYLEVLAKRFSTTYGDKDLLDVATGKKKLANKRVYVGTPTGGTAKVPAVPSARRMRPSAEEKYVFVEDLRARFKDANRAEDLWPVYGAKDNKAGWFTSNGQVGWVPLLTAFSERVPYRLLNGFSNSMRRLAFTGHFNVQYRRLRAIGWSEEDAASAAAERAMTYVDRVMYSPGMTAGEKELGKFFYFLPAYRQAVRYWGEVVLQHPILMKDIRERFKQDFPMMWAGDYGAWIPLPFFLTGGPVESITPGFTLPILLPMRAANTVTGWENVKVSDGDTETGKDDVYEWRYTGNTKLDWLHESAWTNPVTGFASKDVSPISWLDDLLYAVGMDDDWLTNVEWQGAVGRGMTVAYSIGLALRKDPISRKKAANQIMMAQISRGYAPNIDAYEMRLKGSPFWYALCLGFLQGEGKAHGIVEHPEALFQVMTRQFLPRKITYKPSDIGRITSEAYEEPSQNVWISDAVNINGWQLFGDEEARTLAEAEWEFYSASGNEDKQREILDRYPKLRFKRNFYKQDAHDRAEMLSKEEYKWLIPYVTGKNSYGADGFPITIGEYDARQSRGAIALRSNDETLAKINKMYLNSTWDKKRWALEKVRDKRLKDAHKFMVESIKNDNTLPNTLKQRYLESLEGYEKGWWGETSATEYYSGQKVPLKFMNRYAAQKWGKRGYLKHQLEWNPWAINAVHEANMSEIGAINPQQVNPEVIDYSIRRKLVGTRPEGTYSGGLEQYYTSGVMDRFNQEFGAGRIKRISDAILDIVRPADMAMFDPKRGISAEAYKKKLKDNDSFIQYSMRKIIQEKYYNQNSAAELGSALPGLFDPETGIGTELEMDDWLVRADIAYNTYQEEISDKYGVKTYYGDKYDAAKKKYDATMAKMMKEPIAAIWSLGYAGTLLYSPLTDPGGGKTWSKVYSDYIVKNITKSNPDYEEMVESLPIAGSARPEYKFAANAWASICNAAIALRNVVEEERRTDPEGGHITEKKNQGYRKLKQYADAWKERSDRFKRQWNEWGGDKMISDLLAEAW